MGPAEGPGGGGEQTGTVTLTAVNGQTEVVVDIIPGDPADEPQPLHIHEGSCPGVGSVAFDLTDGGAAGVVGGSFTAIVDVSLTSLLAGDFSINVHKSTPEISVYVSCGDITAPTPTPGELPPTGGPAGESSGVPWELLTALVVGGVALAGGAVALRRGLR